MGAIASASTLSPSTSPSASSGCGKPSSFQPKLEPCELNSSQIDRVIGDLARQVEEFRSTGGNPICIGIVGVNFTPVYTSYEGDREYLTDGKKRKHPLQEAAEAESRLLARAAPSFYEFQILRFRATNVSPFPFE